MWVRAFPHLAVAGAFCCAAPARGEPDVSPATSGNDNIATDAHDAGASAADTPAARDAPLSAKDAERPTKASRILVVDLVPLAVSEALAGQATEFVAQVIADRPGHDVTTMADKEHPPTFAQNQQLRECVVAACVRQAMPSAAIDRVVTGSIGLLGVSLTVSLNLIAVEGDQVEKRLSTVVTNSEVWRQEIERAVQELFGWRAPVPQRFSLPTGREASFAVVDVSVAGLSTDESSRFSQLIAAELETLPAARVLTRAVIEAGLQSEGRTEIRACAGDTGCLVAIGGGLGVSFLVAGHIGKLANTYVVSLRLIDPARGVVDNRVTETFSGREDQLAGAIRHAARNLVGRAREPPGSLRLSSSNKAVDLWVDGKRHGRLPVHTIANLPVGRHAVRLSGQDHHDWTSDVYVDPAAETLLHVELQPRPGPWYESWVVWTIASGVAVALLAGTVTTALVLDQNARQARTHNLELEIHLPQR